MFKLWGLLKSDEKILQNSVVESEAGGMQAFHDCLSELCRLFDIEKPVVLRKHEMEFENFGRTVFRPSDFIESVNFSRLEVENITDDKSKSNRNIK
ncbi:MAG: hypothetical protein ACOYI4_06580 [Christensenellales bacterium]|jgi:hypothetical protein